MPRIGDSAPLFNLPACDERRVVLRDQAGHPLLLLFFAKDDMTGCDEILQAVQGAMPLLHEHDVSAYSISLTAPNERAETHTRLKLGFTLLSDVDEHVSRQYGVCFNALSDGRQQVSYTRCAFLLDHNLRVIGKYRLADIPAFLEALVQDLPKLKREEPRVITQSVAPVLMIPNVIDRDFCEELIQLWETDGNEDSGFMKRSGDTTIGVYDYNIKIRRDHFIKDETEIKRRLDRALQHRVFPEVEKTFHFALTRREDYRIACYDSDRGGFFRAHRDNTTGGTAHRLFAMSLNLNSEAYEGGCLRFPEYSPHLYKPDTGSAIIFSGAMMHEATDLIGGRRFVLLSFLYGDKQAAERLAYEQAHLKDGRYETVNLNEAR